MWITPLIRVRTNVLIRSYATVHTRIQKAEGGDKEKQPLLRKKKSVEGVHTGLNQPVMKETKRMGTVP